MSNVPSTVVNGKFSILKIKSYRKFLSSNRKLLTKCSNKLFEKKFRFVNNKARGHKKNTYYQVVA